MALHKGLSEPHVLLASKNVQLMKKNLAGVLSVAELQKIEDAVNKEVASLFRLGQRHLTFAKGLPKKEWRQRVSRLYYAVYNFRRAVQLKDSGSFSTDSSDHNNVDVLPQAFSANVEAHKAKLKDLRDDRNVADYSHLAIAKDLRMTPADAEC